MGTKKLRKNFYFLFIGLGLLVSFSVCAIMYLQFRSHIKTSYFGTLGSVANMLEQQYPVIYNTSAIKQGVLNNEDWIWDIHYHWEEVVKAFDLAFIYYIEKNEKGDYVFIMDTYFKRDQGYGWLGTPVWPNSDVPAGVNEAWETQKIQYSPYPSHEEYWGILVSAILPIVVNGETVGLLGVDYDISYVNALERRILFFLLFAFAASLVMTAFLAFLGSRSVVVSIEEREQVAREANERRQEIESLMGALKSVSASKNAFLSKISKAMSDPINNIVRISSLISGKEDINQEMQKNLELINESGAVLYDVINDIMDILKIEAGELRLNNVKYKLPDLINDITAQFTLLAEGTPIKYKLIMDENLPVHLGGDMIRIRLICNHLISNAFKYTTKGIIAVNVACKRQKGFVWLIIKVSDTGIGIPEDKIENIFNGYGQINTVEKFKSGGSGLGLYISKQLVDLMKGTLKIASELGRGSIFTLCLPQKLLSEDIINPKTGKALMNFTYSKQL